MLLIACLVVIIISTLLVREVILETRHQMFSELMLNIKHDIQRVEAELGDTGILKSMGLETITEQVIEINQSELIARLESSRIGHTGIFSIFDYQNRILTHSNATLLEQPQYPAKWLNIMREQQEGDFLFERGAETIHTTFFVSTHWHWLVILEMSEKEILAPEKKLLRYIPILVIGLFLIVLLFLRLMSRTYSKRIEQTVDFLQARQNGDYSPRLSIGAQDEIGIIQTEINTLVANVEQQKAEIEKNRDFLALLSSTDALTELANRREFDCYLDSEWQKAIVNNTDLSLILIDIDFFKVYNDNYGHLAGDNCLKQVAQTLSSANECNNNLLARYGGEEFAVILPNTKEQDAKQLAEKLRKRVEQQQIPHKYSVTSACITISLGIACLKPQEGQLFEQLISQADSALYQAKDEGRNQTRIFSSSTKKPCVSP